MRETRSIQINLMYTSENQKYKRRSEWRLVKDTCHENLKKAHPEAQQKIPSTWHDSLQCHTDKEKIIFS